MLIGNWICCRCAISKEELGNLKKVLAWSTSEKHFLPFGKKSIELPLSAFLRPLWRFLMETKDSFLKDPLCDICFEPSKTFSTFTITSS